MYSGVVVTEWEYGVLLYRVQSMYVQVTKIGKDGFPYMVGSKYSIYSGVDEREGMINPAGTCTY